VSLSYTAPRPVRLSALLFPGLLLAVGCQGAIGGANGNPGKGGNPGTGGTSVITGSAGSGGATVPDISTTAMLCAQQQGALRAGRTPLRRLTRSQLDNTLRDLVGVTGNLASVIAADEHIGPFTSNALVPITDLVVQQHSELAVRAAGDAAARMNTIAGCDLAAATSTTCVTSFVETFGRKAYRRPLATDERDQYVALYTMEKAAGTAAGAFQQVVETMLQSPFFVYHVDVGAGAPSGTPVRLTSYELASRLSYFLWNTMPDEALFARAAAGTLQDDAVLAAEVERMLADARAADAIPSFHLQWLGLDSLESTEKDAALFPQWNAAMASAMRAETAAFTDHVVRRGDGLMSTLLTASFSFPQGPLFQLYGVSQPAGFRAGDQVTLDSAQRGGILTQGAFLAAHAHRDQTSPVHRGIFVRENILCQTLQPPPADVNTTPPPPSTAATTRQRFANHESDARCAACHQFIDPIGLAFENYDSVGAFRTQEGGVTIDVSGEVVGGKGNLAGKFNGALELGRKLAASPDVANCFANQWFRFALGRMEAAEDACSLQAMHETFAATGGNIRELIIKMVKGDAFRHVRATGATP
jgi:Protein of unknown function (DUF1592)/Protein of unknown function (DUF1588)/Protein of unknown function (DUF1595)/Protein of unknown function (DUF1585)/Protein of unknown function (DUF1587)